MNVPPCALQAARPSRGSGDHAQNVISLEISRRSRAVQAKKCTKKCDARESLLCLLNVLLFLSFSLPFAFLFVTLYWLWFFLMSSRTECVHQEYHQDLQYLPQYNCH